MGIETGLIILLVGVTLVAAAATLALWRHDRELTRIAELLDARDRDDASVPSQITLEVRSAGLVALARSLNAGLERECERRIAAERAQGAFQQDLASLSHDIRTPLAGAQGYLQLAERATDPAERNRYTEQAVERLDAMRGLVDGLFEYARASDPTFALDLEPLELMPVLSDALLAFYPQLSARGWEPRIECADEEVRVLANRGALDRVLANLTVNALRYGSGAPVVEVVASGTPVAAANLGAATKRSQACGPAPHAVAIRLSNPVAEPERIDAERLFDRFYRSDAARTGEGTGLGLAIVARLVAAMDGHVAARLAGTTLTIEVTLPRA